MKSILIWLLLFVAELHCAQARRGNTTAFPDTLYPGYGWRDFQRSGLADRTIDPARIDGNLMDAAVFYASVRYRESAGVKPPRFSPRLRDAARYQSLEMARRHIYSHENPENPAMRDPGSRARHFGVMLPRIGENLGTQFLLRYESGRNFWFRESAAAIEFFYGSRRQPGAPIEPQTYAGFAEAIVRDWADSAPHRDNLLDGRFTQLGCGCAPEPQDSGKTRIPSAVCTQDFAGR